MKRELKYQHTIYACFIGYVVQAVVNNFVPLLFLTFIRTYQISLSQITLLVTFNFGIQLLVDLLSVKFVDKIGYRASILIAHITTAAGLIGLTILPEICANPYHGLLISVAVYAIGGGLIEVLVSPMVEACPTEKKEAAMSLLHSFYCFGHVGVVLLSTLFFTVFGIEHWKWLAYFWAMIPILNGIFFARVPIATMDDAEHGGLTLKQLFTNKQFYIMLLLMICAGASEQAVSQWASAYAEKGLGVSKMIGDLAGPLLFAFMMGASRAWYGKYSEKIALERFMALSTVLCIGSYLVISLCSNPILGLMGCGLCGLSVGILWPGTFSMAAASIRGGGTAMFALLALGGDLGCQSGPTLVGFVSNASNGGIQTGILTAIIFPLILLAILIYKRKSIS